MILLKAKRRAPRANLGKMRKNGVLPAVFYPVRSEVFNGVYGKREKAIPISVALKNFGDTVAAKDIKLSSGVTLMEKPEEVVVSVHEPKEEVEEKPAEPVDLSTIEVEKKGKEAKEGESAEPAAGPVSPKGSVGANEVKLAAGKETKERRESKGK